MTNVSNSVDFDDLDGDLAASGVQSSASEVHGYLVGWLSCGQEVKPGGWQESVSIYLGIEQLTTQCEQSLDGLIKSLYMCLAKMDSSFQVLLPDDDVEMMYRVNCLGQWCTGFLSAFAEGYTGDLSTLSEEAQEAFTDLQAIAGVEDDEDSEQSERDYMEVVEFVKVACQIIAAECGKFIVPDQKGEQVH